MLGAVLNPIEVGVRCSGVLRLLERPGLFSINSQFALGTIPRSISFLASLPLDPVGCAPGELRPPIGVAANRDQFRMCYRDE